MKKSILVVALGVFGIAGHLYAMEAAKKVKVNDVKITLEDAEVSISANQFEGFKGLFGDKDEITGILKAGAPYALPSVNKVGFDFIIKHVELIKNKNSEGLKGEFKKLYEADTIAVFIRILDVAAYLVIDEVLAVASEFINETVFSMIKDNPERLHKFLKAILELSQKKHKLTRFFYLNTQDKKGKQAFIWAVWKGYKEIVELFINGNADLNLRYISGHTALMLAVENGHREIVEMLIAAGADLDRQEDKHTGNTALMWVAKNGHKEIVMMLVEAGADLDMQDESGWTALMMAVRQGHKEIAEMLINAKADLNIQNNAGITALRWAVDGRHEKIVELLKEALLNQKMNK